jgi:hypothetical protein
VGSGCQRVEEGGRDVGHRGVVWAELGGNWAGGLLRRDGPKEKEKKRRKSWAEREEYGGLG